MKKNLLKITAFLITLPIISYESHADISPAVSIKGRSSFSVYGIRQKQSHNRSRGYHSAVEGSEVTINVDRKSDRGHEQSLVISMDASPVIQAGPNPPIFKQAYVQFRGPGGTLQIGNVYSIPETMVISGGSVLVGNNGYDGNLWGVFNASSGVILGTDMAGNVGAATKLTYLSPRFGVWSHHPVIQLGIDFTPDSEHMGNAAMVTNRSQSSYDQGSIYGNNVVGYGINYMDDFNDWQVQVAYCGLRGTAYDGRDTSHLGKHKTENKATRHTLHPFRSWEIGGTVVYKDSQFAWGFVHNGRSSVQKRGVSQYTEDDAEKALFEQFSTGNAGKLFNLGFSQAYGPFTGSLGYQRNVKKTTNKSRTSGKVFSVGGQYTLAEGLATFLEVNQVRHKSNIDAMLLNDYEGGLNVDPVKYPKLVMDSNKGIVCGSGLKITF